VGGAGESDAQARRDAWIEKSLTRRSKTKYAIAAFFIRVLPRCFGVGSGVGLVAISIRYIITFFIASTPFWVAYFQTPGDFDLSFAIWATVILAGLMLSSGAINTFWLNRKSDTKILRLRQSVAAFEANLQRDIAKIVNPERHIQNDKEREILQRILATMADETRAHLRNFDETSIQATLLLFSDEDFRYFLCRARARSDRPTGHTAKCDDSIAYAWLKHFPDQASTVHDITKQKVFPHRLSDGAQATSYRSILILPLTVRDESSHIQNVRGVVTLDSRRRYEFWGARRQELESLLEPHIRWIMAITGDHPHILRINGSA